MIPDIDAEIGLGRYTTPSLGTGGRIKSENADFEVRERLWPASEAMIAAGGAYAVYVMRKSGIDTAHALGRIRRRTGMRLKALGLKDARAVTEQYVCAVSRSARRAEYDDGGVSLRQAGGAPRPLAARDMMCNEFTVRIRGAARLGEFGGWGCVLNYYAYQRFGSARPVTHRVGRAIVRGEWERAVEELLLLSRGEARGADYAAIAARLPRAMDVERAVASSLAGGAQPEAAMRAAPLSMRRFYVQAYQSYVFNCALSRLCEEGEELFLAREGDVCYGAGGRLGRFSGSGAQLPAVPTVGHSYYAKTRFEPAIARVMSEERIRPADFGVGAMPEAGAAGGFRTAAIACAGAAASGEVVRVSLPRGSYATALLREIIKPDNPVSAGLAQRFAHDQPLQK